MTTKSTTRKAAASNKAGQILTGALSGRKAPTKPAAKKAAAKAPAKTTKKAAADKPKAEQTFEERDWSYLDDKDPNEQHELLAREINRRTDLNVYCDGCEELVEISAKQVQAVLAMFPHFQRSATNKNRSGYHGLAPEIVSKRSEHMTAAHAEAKELIAARPAKKATRKRAAKKTTAA